MKTKQITIFTDGSSRGNPGPGGWGVVIVKSANCKVQSGEHFLALRLPAGRKVGVQSEAQLPIQNSKCKIEAQVQITELGGYEKMTTNNRMELTACLQGLLHASKNGGDMEVTVYTDSAYVINGITKWIHGWKKNDWKKLDPKSRHVIGEVLNRDLWEKLGEIVYGGQKKRVEWMQVGGHVGIVGNERSDHIATDFADGNKVELYEGPLEGYDLPNILDISHDEELSVIKKSSSSHSKARAYSYVSSVDGVIETHHTWALCEKRVKGTKGARYKKSLNIADEARIIGEFGEI